MTINGVEFEIDFTDADTVELIEKECQRVYDESEKLKKIKDKISPAEGIRQECKIVKEFLDNVLGDGSSEKIFGNKNSLNLCLNAYEEMVNTYQEQNKKFYDRINKYSPDRLQR